ncbi:helix-turn-helix domain-containing protein [Zobellia nedashkovskayae]
MAKQPINAETKFITKVIQLIHEDLDNSTFGVSELSTKLGLSESQVYRKLKAISGKSTAVFIRTIRLESAREQLQTTDKTVSEVAYAVGFNDSSWFSRAFKEEYGFAPSSIFK